MPQNKRAQKCRYKVKVIEDGKIVRSREVAAFSANAAVGGYGFFFIRIPANLVLQQGAPYRQSLEGSVEIEFLGKVPRAKYTPEERATRAAARIAAQAQRKEREEKLERERRAVKEKDLLIRRSRIINEIELAFEKKLKNATHYVVCDECSAKAVHLLLAREPEGSTVPFDQISGARCGQHWGQAWQLRGAVIPCACVEFFYDGLRQLYINRSKPSDPS
jgi:hypothetical protein